MNRLSLNIIYQLGKYVQGYARLTAPYCLLIRVRNSNISAHRCGYRHQASIVRWFCYFRRR
ncbi:MAG: hypothetical protein ACJAYN_001358 [Bermanella sp.]|jgi:hypothetical protein